MPVYHESRITKLSLNEAELPKVDSESEEITEGEEEGRKQKLKTKWTGTVVFAVQRVDASVDAGGQ